MRLTFPHTTVARVILLGLTLGACARTEHGTDCTNGRDDDDDALVDCADPGCGLEPACGLCGNGELDPGEACDDGNTVDGDDCTSRCRDPLCGNGELDGDEACDDGNLIAADGCSALCEVDRCGDRIVNRDLEECERFYPVFQFVLWGGKSPSEAISAALIDTAGEA